MGSERKAAKVKDHKRNGVHMSFWLSDELVEKLDALAESSGMSRTKVWKALLEGRSIPDRSYRRMCNEIAKIGGLIKGKVMSGKDCDARRLGQELVEIANALRSAREAE